jgi:hypothetical protein
MFRHSGTQIDQQFKMRALIQTRIAEDNRRH